MFSAIFQVTFVAAIIFGFGAPTFAQAANSNEEKACSNPTSMGLLIGLQDIFALPFPSSYFHDLSPMELQLRYSSPRYEITQDSNKYQVTVDVPGVKLSDIKVEVLQNGRLLKLSGERKGKTEAKVAHGTEKREFASKFQEVFTLDEAVDTKKLSAYMVSNI